MNFGNDDKTEIKFPVDEDGMIEIEAHIHVGIDEYSLGRIVFHEMRDMWAKDTDSVCGLSTKYLGTTKFKIKASDIETDLDVRGIMISKLEQELEKEKADHEVRKNAILNRISELQAITYEG